MRQRTFPRDRGGLPLRIATSTWAALIAASCGAAAPAPVESDPEIQHMQLIAEITPGKPGAPTEIVTLTIDGGESHLDIRRESSGGADSQWSATPDVHASVQLWSVVEDRLLNFSPVESAVQAADFGTRTVRFTLQKGPTEAVVDRGWTWSRPLENEAPMREFFRDFGAFARTHAPDALLAYFPK